MSAVAFILISVRETFLIPGSFGRSIAESLIVGAIGLWMVDRVRGEPFVIPVRPIFLATITYGISSVASFAAAQPEMTTAEQNYSLSFIFGNLTLIATVLMISSSLTTVHQLILVMKGLVLGGALSATFALIEFSTGWDAASRFTLPGLKEAEIFYHLLIRNDVVRAQGSSTHPLELAAVLLTLIPLAIGVQFYARVTGARSLLWSACTALLLLGALVTVSRTVFIGVGASLLVMAWRWPLKRWIAILGVLLGAFVVGLLLQLKLVLAFVKSFSDTSTDPSLLSRELGRSFVLSRFRDNFWFGHGAGTYPVDDSHPVLDNEYFSRLFDAGIIGLASYAVLLGVAVVVVLRVSAAQQPSVAALGSGLAGSVTALMFAGSVLDLSGFGQIWYLLWIVIALCSVAARLNKDRLADEFEKTIQAAVKS